MSGIYIPGMEMPQSCFNCLFRSKIDPDTLFCDIRQAKFEEMFSHFERRDKVCPLVPVPDHGDLIDRDALCEGRVSNDNVVICAKCAPTIIPGEEGDNGN